MFTIVSFHSTRWPRLLIRFYHINNNICMASTLWNKDNIWIIRKMFCKPNYLEILYYTLKIILLTLLKLSHYNYYIKNNTLNIFDWWDWFELIRQIGSFCMWEGKSFFFLSLSLRCWHFYIRQIHYVARYSVSDIMLFTSRHSYLHTNVIKKCALCIFNSRRNYSQESW